MSPAAAITGSDVTLNVLAVLVPRLPALSDWEATTVYVPAASAFAWTDHAPEESGVAFRV